MSGFNNDVVDKAFFPDGRFKSNFLCNIGYGDPSKLFDRSPRGVEPTLYGRALLAKTALFVPLLLLGRANRDLIERRSPLLTRSIAVEIALIAAIVVVVSVLTELRPGSELPARSGRALGVIATPVRLGVDRLEEAGSVLERRKP